MTSSSYIAFAAALLVASSSLAQTQSTGLKEPVALTVHRDSGHAFIVEAGTGRLLRWNGEKTESLSDRFISDGSFSSVAALCFREANLLTAIGMLDGDQVQVVTLKVDVLGSVTAVEGLTGPLELGGPVKGIASACATDFAIYLARIGADGIHEVWRVPAGRTSQGKPELLIKGASDTISGMTISPQGHVVLSVTTEAGENRLRFHHAETGRLLLNLRSDLRNVVAMAYSPSGLLYATGNQLGREGLFRLDVFFDGARQAVRSTEIAKLAKLDKIAGLDFTGKGECIALVGSKQDGRAISIKVN